MPSKKNLRRALLGCYLITCLNAIANNDLVVNTSAPLWHSGTETQKLTQLCDSEKNQRQKILVCNFAISRYAKIKLNAIPKEAKSQAMDLLQNYESQPKDSPRLFALHDSHQTLGRVALTAGDLKLAKEELAKSIQVPLTPPLQHIGPKMILAKELLERGEKKAVLDYLDQSEKIWTGKDAKDHLKKWRSEIEAGKIPRFQ